MSQTFMHSVAGVVVGVCLTGLALYAAQKSNNATLKSVAGHITAGFGAP